MCKFMICVIIYGIFFLCVCVCLAQGHGAKGQNEYEFSLEFLSPVKPEVCIHWKITSRYLFFILFFHMHSDYY